MIGDWILGVGGKNLGSNHRKCILLMKVTEKLTFQDYWEDDRFSLKKPCRNGSNVMMLGDNIYHKNGDGNWIQEDSHHSNADGSENLFNLDRDTGDSDQVLVSNFFFYFGGQAVTVDLDSVSYFSGPGYKKIDLTTSNAGKELIESAYNSYKSNLNCIVSDPFQFMESHQRVDQVTNKIS